MSEMENQTLTSLNFSEIGDRPHVTIREPITERTTRLSDLYITQEGADLSGGDDDEGNLTDSVAIGQLIEHCSHLTDRVEQLETELSEFQESSINREQVLRGYIEGRFADMENRRQEALDEMDLEVVKCLKRRDVLWGEELKKLFKKTSTPRLPLSLPSLSSRKRSAPQQLSFDVYVHIKWKEDDFFGYQYLNGINPIMIQKCKQIPSNFPVTNCMVSGFLDKSSSLQKEMEKGNIFLVDYQLLDDIPANTIHGRKQYIAAPLCLLYKDTHKKLKPIAIQLKQTADPENPIFLPNDKEEDWLLAKIFVRSADFNLFGLVAHLLRTHLLAEVFCMATLRHLASVHPLYKAFSTGGIGMYKVLQKAQDSMTYSSLCLPDDIKARGVEDIPCYYYRDDGLKLWAVINRIFGMFNKDTSMSPSKPKPVSAMRPV
ncbi:UNVERIFIED_CONTAM: hypothetical protein FKN15_014950 [Acipenser sinensis]